MTKLSTATPTKQRLAAVQHDAAQPKLTVAPLSEGQVLHAFGDEFNFLLSGTDTGGQLAMCLSVTPPQGGPPPHYHLQEDEWFLVLEGEPEFLIDGSWQKVAVGTAVFVPRGTVHTFRNVGTTPLKLLIQTAPSGFDLFMARCAAEFAQPGPPDMERIVAISAEHGIHYVTD